MFTAADGTRTPVRIFEVSRTGASMSMVTGIAADQRGTLTFEQLADRPSISVAIVDARRPSGRVGVAFEGGVATALAVAAIAAARSTHLSTL